MKKKWLAIILSFLIPGAGHMYLGDMSKGIILIVIFLASNILAQTVNPVFGLIYVVIWVYAMISSAKLTNKVNENFSNTQ